MENIRYTKGELVVYGTNGICIVDDIQKMAFPMETEEHTYYVLRPVGNKNSTLFVPADREELVSKMRALLTREEIDGVLSETGNAVMEWIENKNERANAFRSIMNDGKTEELLRLLRCIHMRKMALAELGKRLASSDENVLLSAEKLVREEFAFVLRISEGELGEYIQSKIS